MAETGDRADGGLDVILQADAIRPPLTGIGRYATELAKGLRGHADVTRLRYFGLTSWIEDPLRDLVTAHQSGRKGTTWESSQSFKSLVRAHLSSSRLAVRAFHHMGPPLAGWRLRREVESVYHSPNFLLPHLPGRAVATIHDLSHELFPQFHPIARVEYMRRAMPDMLRRATHLITDAESVRQEVIQCYGWPSDRITTVPLGVDASYHPREKSIVTPWLDSQGLRANGYCLYVGTIEPRKNVDSLINAYSRLPTALRKEFPLVLAGGAGWSSAATHERIRMAVSEGWARYLSFVPQTYLPFLYAGARVFAFPSHYEGFGLPVLEAMASGVPVLTSDIPSMRELAGTASRMISPCDVVSMTFELEGLLCHEQLRTRLRDAALARASTFTWARCVDATVCVYRNI